MCLQTSCFDEDSKTISSKKRTVTLTGSITAAIEEKVSKAAYLADTVKSNQGHYKD